MSVAGVRYAFASTAFRVRAPQGVAMMRIELKVRLPSAPSFAAFVHQHGNAAPSADALYALIANWRALPGSAPLELFSHGALRRLIERELAAGPALARCCIEAIAAEHAHSEMAGPATRAVRAGTLPFMNAVA